MDDNDRIMAEISSGLEPDPQLERAFTPVGNAILRILRQKYYRNIHTCELIGSIPKGTAVRDHHDFDVVFFVGGMDEPPDKDEYSCILRQFKDNLADALTTWSFTIYDIFIRAEVHDLSVDIIIAPYYVYPHGLAVEEAEHCMNIINSSPNPYQCSRLLGPACAMASVVFLADQSPICLQAVDFPVENYLPARYQILEYLVVHADKQAICYGGRLRCIMITFWENLLDIHNIEVCFDNTKRELFEDNPNACFEPPYIIDPHNAFNNLLYSENPFFMKNIKIFLNALKQEGERIAASCYFEELDRIYESYKQEYGSGYGCDVTSMNLKILGDELREFWW